MAKTHWRNGNIADAVRNAKFIFSRVKSHPVVDTGVADSQEVGILNLQPDTASVKNNTAAPSGCANVPKSPRF